MPVELDAYVTVFLFRQDRVLLLRRSTHRGFAPGMWAGVGGRLDPEDGGDLRIAALRELREESGIAADSLEGLSLRVVLTQPEQGRVVVLAYFAARTVTTRVAETPEGELRWVPIESVWDLDMIANARAALSEVMRQDSENTTGVRFGICEPGARGALARVVMETEADMETARVGEKAG